MKFKKLAKSVAAVMLGATVGISAFAFVGCKDSEKGNDEPPIIIDDPSNAKISVSLDKTEITAGSSDTVQATATIEDFSTKTVNWSVSGDGKDYVDINTTTGVITLKNGLYPQISVDVTVTATSTVNNSIKASAILTIKPLVVTGEVGELKTEMFEELGNASITVTGEVTDIVDDLTSANKDVSRTYDYTVKMSDGEWYGEWNEKGNKSKEISNYRRSENADKNGKHTFDEVYINKYNKEAQKPVTDYTSIPAIWENQHLWNHLKELGNDIENWWAYNATDDVYVYQFDNASEEDLLLRTYLAFSLTPMLGNGDTLENIFLTVEDGKITKMEATTAMLYSGGKEEGSADGATTLTYTTLTATFTEVGTTTVPKPTPYEIDEDQQEDMEILQTAINNLKTAANYTFRAKETTISAPSVDEGDYTPSSVTTYRTSASNYASATGTEGVVGQVTSDAVLFARTIKYTAAMDNNLYKTEYSGYKKISDNSYDYFEYDGNVGALAGQRKYTGSFADLLPKFDFSINLFECVGDTRITTSEGLKRYPTYVLREPAITRDIALEVSAHNYAVDATDATYGQFEIIVNDDTNQIYSISYPYNINYGTYLGIVETTFSKIGSTTLPEDTFDGYVERVVPTEWSQLNVKYYHPDHTTTSPYEDIDAGTLLTNIFGADASKMPSPEVFFKAFEDTLAGPFFDWETDDKTAEGGSVTYHDWMSINVHIDECDENYNITQAQHDKHIAILTEELAKIGFTKSVADSQTVVHKDYTTNYSVYTNGSIMIKVENMGGRFFYISFLPSEIWWHFNAD